MLIATNLILLSLRLSAASAIGSGGTSGFPNVFDNANTAAGRIAKLTGGVGHGLNSASRAVSGATLAASATAFRGVTSAGRAVQDRADAVGRDVVGGAATAIHATGHGVGIILDSATLGSLIRPADKITLPAITPIAAATPAGQAAAAQTGSAQWPIHGAITTPFGVPEWPYEPVHTGLDISDGKAPGVTPIVPFKPGVVAAVIRSGGLGNHVIVDNGGGVTSVYGHLYSIAVEIGQPVGENTVLGYEGSTGASTGTHLHFEIRLNGQPVDPRKFINGHP